MSIIIFGDATAGGEVHETAREFCRRLGPATFVVLRGGRGNLSWRERGRRYLHSLVALIRHRRERVRGLGPADRTRPSDRPIHAGPPEASRNQLIAAAGSVVVSFFGGTGAANEVVHALAFGLTVYGLRGAA